MPRARRRYRNRKPRRYRRKNLRKSKVKYNDGNMQISVKNQGGPLPMKFTSAFAYIDYAVDLNPGASVPAYKAYRLNGLYDPDQSGIGHQPLGYDQMMEMYHNYCVIGTKAVIQFFNTDSTDSMYVGAFIHQTATPTIVPQEVMENGLGSYAILQPKAAGSDATSATMTIKFSAKKWFGTKRLIGEDSYIGTKTTNPSTQAYLIVWAIGRSEDTGPAWVDTRLDYVAVMTNPEYLLSS